MGERIDGSRWRYPFTEEDRDLFLATIADGFTRQEAAIAVQEKADSEGRPCHSTASRWRGLYQRDAEFADAYEEALKAAGEEVNPQHKRIRQLEQVQLAHRVLDETIVRALDTEKGKVGSSNRVLYNLGLLTVDLFEPLLHARTRHIHEGAVGIYQLPQIDVDKWTLDQHEEFMALEARRNELIALARPDGAPALPPAPQDDAVDAEFTEVDAA